MTRIIACCSGKGGVGKTTLTANLAVALSMLGQDVIAMDANLTTPDLAMHLGIPLAPCTLHDVLKRKSRLRSALYPHPLGLRVLPGTLRYEPELDYAALPEVTLHLLGRSDFVLLDSSAGLGQNSRHVLKATDEVLLIANPNLPAVTATLKTLRLAERYGKEVLGVVLNRVNKEGRMRKTDVEEMLEVPVLVEVLEDPHVQASIAARIPVVAYRPESPAAQAFIELAHKLCGLNYRRPTRWNKFWKWLGF